MAAKKKANKKEKSTTAPGDAGLTNFRTLAVEVTAEDIAQGKPGDHQSCPVYFALKRAAPKGQWSVRQSRVVDLRNGDEFDLMVRVQVAIQNFDAGKGMRPLKFELMRFAWM
jgi:hypothetical protein